MRRVLKLVIAVSVAVTLLAALALLGGGWYYSDQIEDGSLEVDRTEAEFDLEIVAVGDGQVTIRATPQADENGEWRKKGVWGLEQPGSYSQVGAIIALDDEQVVREVVSAAGAPSAGSVARIDSYAFPGDPEEAHGLPFEEVSFSSPLGEFPAWFVDGPLSTWAIFVHGRGASQREALRMLPAVSEAGLPSLMITYRNDEGVPANPDGYHWFGHTEWEDLEGAARYALSNGAEDLVLVGYSMGGAIVTNFLYQSSLTHKVRAVVLDSPILDFGAAVDHGGAQRRMPVVGLRIPPLLTSVAKLISSVRFGIDYSELDYLDRADKLTTPMLVFHGDGDKTVPVATSDELADARPDIVRYVRVPETGHMRAWNMGPETYEAAVAGFLSDMIGEARATAGSGESANTR